MNILCEICKDPVNPKEPGTHQYTCGWVKNRTGGGGHAVALPKRQSRWAHDWCIKRAISGWVGQGSLLEEDNPPPTVEPGPTNAAFDTNGMLMHLCNVCGSNNAPYGYDVALRSGSLGLWYCREHKPKDV
jgi:hypothetical protein